MSKRLIQILIIIIVIIILGIVGYFAYTYYLPKGTQLNSNVNMPANTNSVSAQNQNTNSVPVAKPLVLPEDDKGKISLLAAVFTENYGSYSNQTSLSNFDDLYSYMGASMQKWVETTYKAQIIKDHPRSAYYAIETKVLNVEIKKLDSSAGTAQALINTQRQEFTGSPSNVKVFNQNLLLNFKKISGKWIVDSAYWQ